MYLDKLGLQDIISYQRLAWRRTQSSLHSLICSSQWFLLFNLNINEPPIAWDRKLTGEISWIQKHISLKKHIFGNRVEWIICGWARLGLSWLQNFRFRVTIICEGKNFNDVLLKQHKIRNFNTFKLFVWYTSVRELHDGCHQIFRVKETRWVRIASQNSRVANFIWLEYNSVWPYSLFWNSCLRIESNRQNHAK